MATYRIETDQGTFDIEADREPTQAEALQAISASNAPVAPSEFEKFRQGFISQEQRPTLNKALESLVTPIKGFAGMVGDVSGITPGVLEALKSESPMGTLARSGIEGARRAGLDILNILQNDKSFGVPILQLGNQAANLLSRTPSEQEIENAFEEQQAQKNQLSPDNQLVAGQISEKLAQGARQAIPLALPMVGAEETGVASVARAPVSKIAQTVETMQSRGLWSVPLEDATTKAIGITAQEGSSELVPLVKARVIEATKSFPTTAQEAFKAAGETQKYLIDKTLDELKRADQFGLKMNTTEALNNAEAAIKAAQPTITQAEVDAALAPFKDRLSQFPDRISPVQGQKFLVEQNDALQNVFQETGVPARKTRGNAQVTARLAIADSLSNQLDDIYKATSGLNESPYRDWGQVAEFKDGLNQQIIGAQKTQAGVVGPETVPFTKPGIIKKALKAVAKPLIPREIESIDSGISTISKQSPTAPIGEKLDPALQQQLLNKYL